MGLYHRLNYNDNEIILTLSVCIILVHDDNILSFLGYLQIKDMDKVMDTLINTNNANQVEKVSQELSDKKN